MMRVYCRRAIKDIVDNRFLNAVTIITIALSVLIFSAFALFFLNASDLFNSWKKGMKIMVYLEQGASKAERLDTKYRLREISGIKEARFISKEEAMAYMKGRLKRQTSLLDNLKENPFPDAFEVTLTLASSAAEMVEIIAKKIETLPVVNEVEYGKQWVERFSNFFNLFKITGYAMGGLFLMAAVFICANTIRLMLYSRREEIEIMRLVGATDFFIKTPFYIEGVIQGIVGSGVGLGVLYAAFTALCSHFEQNAGTAALTIRFLPAQHCALILLCGIIIGWMGCFFSLRHFMKP